MYPLYLLSLLFVKSDKLILFGAWFGQNYSDNAKYVFEAMLQTEDDYKCYWITKNRSLLIGEQFVYAYSLFGLWLHLKARTFVYSSGYDDFISCFLTKKSIKVNLWHGLPLKKIGYDDDINQPKGVKKFLRNLRNQLLPYSNNRCDYVLSPSNFYSNIFKSALKPRKGVLEFGLPRNDVLYQSKSTLLSLKKQFDKIYTYCPTFRDGVSMEYISDDELVYLKKVLSENNFLLIIKLHPADNSTVSSYLSDNIVDFTFGDYDLYQDILPITDCLITDYSSIIFDYSMLNREIVLLHKDYEMYKKSCRSFYLEDFSVLNLPVINTWLSLFAHCFCYDFTSLRVFMEFSNPGKDTVLVKNDIKRIIDETERFVS